MRPRRTAVLVTVLSLAAACSSAGPTGPEAPPAGATRESAPPPADPPADSVGFGGFHGSGTR